MHIGRNDVSLHEQRTYKCGEIAVERPHLTDEQAVKLEKCPKCFADTQVREVKKVEAQVVEGWL